MEQYKEDFIGFLLSTGALKVGGNYSLKSKRISPWFVNIGDFNDGDSTKALGGFYADSILNSGVDTDILYGIPEKGVGLAIATTMGMSEKGKNVPWFFTRKYSKDHGEHSSLSQTDRIKAMIVGRAPKDGQSIVQLDDVFTAGNAKYEARAELETFGDFKYPLLAIAVDRQEVGIDGKSAITEYQEKTGTKVVSVIKATDVREFLLKQARETPDGSRKEVDRMTNYLRVYGTDESHETLGKFPEQEIVGRDKSIVPACDVPTLDQFDKLVKATADIDEVGAYKVGFELGYGYGLPAVVETARKHTKKPIILDHQKAGTDIPDTGKNFARVCSDAGVDAVILFPQAGPETERAWIYHALDHGLKVIVGGRMTHPAYAQSEGGFISDEGAMEMYRIAARAGINDFVVPGNKAPVIAAVKEMVEAEGVDPIFYAPGFVSQGGKIEDATKVAGNRWHAIVGRGIYNPKKRANILETTVEEMREAALDHVKAL
ncbi:MAG: orotidine 5'-phosphate decarboxylase [Nanoarchaeota archaeon]|nr:orotidine 5'-phosphate decarboxylase [Nanoarchaeota archaeon]MBU4124025.1 orotidine 5'-phosphate decarboxylase [Nanoarchaeota archaeon]